MLKIIKIVGIFILALVQVTFLPLNLAFSLIVGLYLYFEDTPFASYLVFLSFLIAVFSGLSFGSVLIAYSIAFGFIKLGSLLVPKNTLSRGLIILLALPVSEIFLVYFLKTL